MKTKNRAVLLFLMLLAGMASAQTKNYAKEPTLKAYDNFNGADLDPTKWTMPWQCGSPAMECVRDIENGQVRLRVRAYGATNSDSGNQLAWSGISFINPAAVTDISAQVTAHNAKPQGCATNSQTTNLAAFMFGTFFNDGSDDPNNDMTAYVQLGQQSPPQLPQIVDAGGFLCYAGQCFGNVDLGPVSVGDQVTLELAWDQPNHQFLVSMDYPARHITHHQSMPYTISDTTPPANPFKSLEATAAPANCTSGKSVADMDVSFDNVLTN